LVGEDEDASTHGLRIHELQRRRRRITVPRALTMIVKCGRDGLLELLQREGATQRGARETWAAVTLSGATRRRTGFYKTASGELAKLEIIVAPIRVKGNIVSVFGIAIPSSDYPPRPSATEELSPRQLDVLRLLVQGKSTNQITADLHLAPQTVRNYVGSLLKTLGARSRLEATLVALRDGVVSLDLD
jgi:DNA-binding CsgD family transcriptional regulator